jgi:hypothetical protein
MAYNKLEKPEFRDVEFMTASDKASVLRDWNRFLDSGFKRNYFTKRLYNHLIQHCSFIAHYNQDGFYSVYFGEKGNTGKFIDQFTSGISAEYGMDYSLRGDYDDINPAMCEVMRKYAPTLKKEIEGTNEEPKTVKEMVLSVPLLESQIRDLLNSNIREDSKEGLHGLLGALLGYSDEGVEDIRLVPSDEGSDATLPRQAFEAYGSFEEWVDAHKHSAPVIQTELEISLDRGNNPSCSLKSYVMGLQYIRSEIDSEISEAREWLEYFEKKGDFSD